MATRSVRHDGTHHNLLRALERDRCELDSQSSIQLARHYIPHLDALCLLYPCTRVL
jgi:hypothetical protein